MRNGIKASQNHTETPVDDMQPNKKLLITIIVITATCALSTPTQKQNDMATITRLDRGYLVIHHATAYEMLGRPTQATQTLWLHLPYNISSVIQAPKQLIKLYATLQDTCDAAYLAAFSDPETGISNTAHTIQQAVSHHKHPILRRKRSIGMTIFDFIYIRRGDRLTLREAEAACKKIGKELPTPARDDQRYRMDLIKYMVEEGIPQILIETTYSHKDYVNRIPPDNKIASKAFPASKYDQGLTYNINKTQFEYTQHNLTEYDDDQDATYAYTWTGRLRVYANEGKPNSNKQYNMRRGMKEDNYDKQRHIPKSHVICDNNTGKNNNRIQRTHYANSRAYLQVVQSCYNTVEHIELQAVTVDLETTNLWQRHNIIIDNTQIAGKRKQTYETNKKRRRKRRWAGLVMKGIAGLAKLGIARKFGKAMLPLMGLNKIAKITPESRKAFGLLKKISPIATALPLFVSAGGLGLSVYRNYKTGQKLSTQRKAILTNQHAIEQQSTHMQTVKMQSAMNKEEIDRINGTLLETQQQLLRVQQVAGSVDAALVLQALIDQVRMYADDVNQNANNNIAEIRETLISVSANVIPGIFIPQLRRGANHLGIAGEQLKPHPDNPISISPLIKNQQIDLYANFLVGIDRWEMYKITPLPKFADGRAYTRKTAFDYALVDHPQKNFISLTHEEARLCKQGTCKATGIIRAIADDACTISMLGMIAPQSTCAKDDTPAKPFLSSSIRGMIYSVPETLEGRLYCKDNVNITKIGVDQAIQIKGMGIVDIPPGCQFITNGKNSATVLGPPREHAITTTAIKVQSKGSAHTSIKQETSRQRQMQTIKTTLNLTNSAKITKSRITLVTTVIIIITICIAILFTLALGKIAWITYLHKQLIKKMQSARTATTQAKTAIQHGLSSVARHADGLQNLLQNRPRFNAYLRGETNDFPMRRHLSTFNIENGQIEYTALGAQENTQPPIYPHIDTPPGPNNSP